MSHPIVIIGASHAGITCAEKLRQYGFAGKIVMMDSVQGMPYQRPPLSKTTGLLMLKLKTGFICARKAGLTARTSR